MNIRRFLIYALCTIFLGAFHLLSYGQEGGTVEVNLPFLLSIPDARSAAMGDAGVAVLPDANASAINPAKLPFLRYRSGMAASYSPWLKHLVSDISLSYLTGFYKLGKQNTIAASLRYFSLGKMQVTDESQQELGAYQPHQLAFDATFARRFSNQFSLATSVRYIRSNLIANQANLLPDVYTSDALAVDFAAYYRQKTMVLNRDLLVGLGAYISNLGPKVNTHSGNYAYHLPANLKMGTAATLFFTDDSQLSLAIDINKLMLSEHPETGIPDSAAVLNDRRKALRWNTGVEYHYHQQFALRMGYSYGRQDQGFGSYLTLGAGFRYRELVLDLAYIPTTQEQTPMANTLRFSLLFYFNKLKQ